MTKSWLVIVLHLNGWESGASFLDQSQSKVNLNWSYHRSLLTLIKISLTVHCQSESYEKKEIWFWYFLCWYSTSAKNTTRIVNFHISKIFIHLDVYLDPIHWPAPSWLVSSIGRALHRYRRGHGFKSRTGLKFFSGPIYNYSFQ